MMSHFSEDEAKRVEFTTSHKYKGREADFVIVAGADIRSYPLVHPTAELFEVFGDSLESVVDAERRLFYVATTRAESRLCYLVGSEDSPFLSPAVPLAQEVKWTGMPSRISGPPDMLLIRIHDAYDVRHRLKEPFGFEFDGLTKTWFAHRPAEPFNFADVRQTLAFIDSRPIEVLDPEGHVIHQAGARL